MTITHSISTKQLDDLFAIFAKPREHHGAIDWVAPAWWYLAYATARS